MDQWNESDQGSVSAGLCEPPPSGTSGQPGLDRRPAVALAPAVPLSGPASTPALSRLPSLRLWFLFVGALVASFCIHEIGHCAVAWFHGCPAIPTPAKEYVLRPLSPAVQNEVALGGIIGTVAALLGALGWLLRRPSATASALLAGTLTAPGFYTLRFLLAGRGHDATEFQEAQTAMGLSYSGHALDWIFLALLVVAAAAWFWRARARLTARLAGRLLLGALTALVAVVLLQSINNAVFDPFFQLPAQEGQGDSNGP
jgi:hypothetical protein